MSSENWVDYGGVRVKPIAFGGHCLLVRRAMTGEQVDPHDIYCRAEDGIILPEFKADQSCWGEVLAVGERVGQRCSERHVRRYRHGLLEKYGMAGARCGKAWPSDLVGSMVFIPLPVLEDGRPLKDVRCMRTAWSSKEAFIEDTLPEFYVRPEDFDNARKNIHSI